MRENPSRSLSKERVLVVLVREQGRCHGRGLRGASNLVPNTPERHSLIARMEDHVAALGFVEARCVLPLWVVHDGKFISRLDLQEHVE